MSKASDLARLLNADGEIQAADIEDGVVTAAKLASTLDLSGKTITNMNPSGVYLGGTGAANYLDDYEEGTWTPTVSSGVATVTDGSYTKIGRQVTVNVGLRGFSDYTSATQVRISLPFTPAATGISGNYFTAYWTFSGDLAFLASNGNSTVGMLYFTSNGDYFNLPHSAINNSSTATRLYFQLTYETS